MLLDFHSYHHLCHLQVLLQRRVLNQSFLLCLLLCICHLLWVCL
ncbi:unnamed protein product [Trichobilharzia regenti]|nr:unnamed protein product [Trichobilharzia regenti]